MSKACNQEDVVMSFLYLESLKKRGVFDSASPDFLKLMADKSIDKLIELVGERERMIDKREEIGEYPVVNLISKDYTFFLDYEEEYSKPISLGDGRVMSRYALEYNKEINTFTKNDYISSSSIKQVVDDYQVLDYNNRETAIASMLKPEHIYHFFTHRIGGYVNARNIVDALDLGELKTEADELEINFNDLKDHIYSIVSNANLYDNIDEDELQNQPILLPVRYDDKALQGVSIEKDTLLSILIEKISINIGAKLEQIGIQNGVEKILNVLKDENNDAIFDIYLRETQVYSDRACISFVNNITVSGLRDAKREVLLDRTYLPQVLDQLDKTTRGTPFEIDLVHSPFSGGIVLIPFSKKDDITETLINPYVMSPSESDPSDFKKYDVRAEKITLIHRLGTDTSNVLIKSIYEARVDIGLNASFNTNKSKSYRINKNFSSDFDALTLGEDAGEKKRRTVVVDEADQEAGGKKGEILTYLFRENASKIVVATGTPVNGMPESTVNILQFGGVMRGEDIEKSKLEFETLYGVYSINSPFLAILVQGIETKDIGNELKSIYSNIIGEEKSKDSTSNTTELYESAVKKLINSLVSKKLIESETAMNIDIHKEASQLAILFNSATKIEAKNKSIDFKTLIGTALTNTHTLTTKEPKISSIKGYASTIASTIGSSATSSTDAGARKNIAFQDFATFKQNFEIENPMMNVNSFEESNRIGMRISQALVSAYKSDMFIEDVFLHLTKTFEGFNRLMTDKGAKGRKVREGLLKTISERNENFENLTESDLYTLSEKTSTGGTDSFAGMYRRYLNYNGDFKFLEKENDDFHNMRVELFREVLYIFNSIMKAVPLYQEKVQRIQENNRAEKDNSKKSKMPDFIVTDKLGNRHNLVGMSYKFSPTILRGERAFDMTDVVNKLNDYGYPSSVIFSFVTDLCPRDFSDILEVNDEGMRMPYRIEIKNRADNEVLDALSSIGAKEKMKEQLKKGANIVNLAQRVITNVANVLNLISAYKEVKEEYDNGKMNLDEKHIFENYVKDKIHIVVNATTSANESKMDIADIFARIKPVDGLEVTLTKRTSMEAILRKSVLYDGKLTCLCSNYRSVSRGFALHYFHKEIEDRKGEKSMLTSTLNFIDPRGGGDGIQVLARLESPMTTENIISLYNGGNDAKQMAYGENASILIQNLLPVSSSTENTAIEKERELSQVFSQIMYLPQEEAKYVRQRVSNILDLPRDFGRPQISVQGERAQMGYTTYEQVMRGEHTELTDKQAIDMYSKEVLKLSDVVFDEEDEVKQEDKQEDKLEVMNDVLDELGVTKEEIIENHQDTAFQALMP